MRPVSRAVALVLGIAIFVAPVLQDLCFDGCHDRAVHAAAPAAACHEAADEGGAVLRDVTTACAHDRVVSDALLQGPPRADGDAPRDAGSGVRGSLRWGSEAIGTESPASRISHAHSRLPNPGSRTLLRI